MLEKNNIKNITLEQKNQEFNNKKPPSFKNIYAKIRKNIKTSFPRSKKKNSFNIFNSKKLTENGNNKNNNSNINLVFNKKGEESRNYNNNVEIIYDNNQDDEIINNDELYYFNKTQKNIQLLYSNYSKKLINSRKDSKNSIKNNCRKQSNYNSKKLNYYSNKNDSSKENKKFNNNKLLIQNQIIKSNKEVKKINLRCNNQYNNIKNKINEKERQNSFEKNSKLLINKKILSKDELIKTKNLYDKVQSARLGNYDIQKLNLNINKDLNNELKIDSNKKTFRMNSQKIVKINEKEFDTEIINQIKRIKKNKLIRQLTKQNSKNHSMHINSNNKTFLLNDTIKNNLNKTKKKKTIVNIYNYPNIRNNLKQNIPYDKDIIFDSADKNNIDNSNNNYFNNYYNMDYTCINFNNMNNTLNNNRNGILNNTNEKNTPKSNNHKNSFSKPYSQEKISSFFYSKPIARLKKRIFNSSSDKDIENSINNLDINNYDFDKTYNENDSLEIKDNKNNVNFNFKKLLISIKILNQIINTQNEIIKEHVNNEINLKKEIEQKEKEIKNYKEISLKLMFYLQNEKEINIYNDLNKKRSIIQKQLLKENNFLRILVSSKVNFQKIINNKNEPINSDIYNKSFYITNNNEVDSSINIYHLKKKNTNNNFHQKIDYNNGIKDKTEKNMNLFYNISYNNIVNRKREKSYENRRNIRNKEKL